MSLSQRALRLLALVLALVACAAGARAQGLGPGIDEGTDTAVVDRLSTMDALPADLTSINPLEALAGAGEAMRNARGTGRGGTQGGGLSTALTVMVVLTVVSLAPSIMLMTTCFVRILIVLGLLRQAMGTQTIPPPQVITGLALFMTLLVMSPTLDRIHQEAIVPYRTGEVQSYDALWEKGSQPVRDFMFAQIDASANWSSVYMILEYRGVDVSDPSKLTRSDVDTVTLVPAYMLSELKVAFQMGFRVYLPFLVIDMVISTMLISMSMMMLPPVLISLPFKLLLFVLVDGWTLVVGGLMHSFAQPEVASSVTMLLPGAMDAPMLVAGLREGALLALSGGVRA